MSRRDAVRRAFAQRSYLFVKIRPDGFLIEDELCKTLQGYVRKSHLVRKLFEDEFLACDSRDGIKARNGTICEQCQHPACQPRLRLHLAAKGGLVCLLDLPHTSANNFLQIDQQAQDLGNDISTWLLSLSVHPHTHWGEVLFKRL